MFIKCEHQSKIPHQKAEGGFNAGLKALSPTEGAVRRTW